MKWLDKNQEKILFFTWCLIILTCLLVIFTSPVKAASPDRLPYVTSSGFNSVPDSEVQGVLNNLKTTYPNDDFSNVLVFKYGANAWWNWSTNTTVPGYDVFVFPDDSCFSNWVSSDGGSSFDDFVLYDSDYKIRLTLTGCYQYTYIHREIGDYYWKSPVLQGENFKWVFGDSSLTEVNTVFNFTYNSNYPVYSSFSLTTTDTFSNEGVIIAPVGNSSVDTSGHATPPINDNGHYIPNVNPDKPTINPYNPTPPQFPNIDTSSLEKLVESLIDITKYGFSYLGDLLNGLVSNLLSNIDSLLDYVVQSFRQGFNNLVGSIHDLATDFYNNMVSLFEPLYDFFNGVATFFNNLIQLGLDGDSFSLSTFFLNLLVPDSEDFADALLDGDIHHVVPLVSSVHTKFVSLFSSFTNLTPSKVLVIPSFTWHGQSFNLSIDFSWYDDYKVYGDTIISGFLIIGYIYWFVLQLSSMFRGGNSIGHDVSKVGGQH